MLISKDILFYIKTTETCNLNCRHCFTSGSNGPQIFFDPHATIDFIYRLKRDYQINHMRFVFHGGEPLMAPIEDITYFYHATKDITPTTTFGLQTNLVFNLNEPKLKFLNGIMKPYGIGTSWDYGYRFDTTRKLSLWEGNVQTLIREGHDMTLMVSLSKDLIQKFEPEEIIHYAIDLGFQHILFERITKDGNANENNQIFPSNRELDLWMFKMFQQTLSHKFYKKIHNLLLHEIMTSFISRQHISNRCRSCEQQLITINADGSLSGCPNSAISQKWGHVSRPPQEFLINRNRLKAMACEKQRSSICTACEVNHICNGDCYKLPWEGDVCAAPKTLMQYLEKSKISEEWNQLIIGQVNEELAYQA